MVRVLVVCAPDSKNIVDRLNKDLTGKCETKIVSFTDVHLHVDSEENDVILVILTPKGCTEIPKIKKEVLEKLFDHQSNVKILFSCQQSQIDSVDNYCGMICDRYSSVARYSTTEYNKVRDDVIACVEQFDGTCVPLQANRFIVKPDIIYMPAEVIIVMFEEENEQQLFQKVVVRHSDKELPATRVHTNVWAFHTGYLPSGDNRISVLCDGQDIGSEILKVCEVDLKKAINAISVAMDKRPLTSLATLLQTTEDAVDEELAKLLISKPSSIVETLLHLRNNYGGGGKSLFEICKSGKLKESFGQINQEKELPKQHSESSSDDDHELRSPLSRNSSEYRNGNRQRTSCPPDFRSNSLRSRHGSMPPTCSSLYRGARDSGVGHSQGTENGSGSGIVNRQRSLSMSARYCSIEPLPLIPRVGSKKTIQYDEPCDDDVHVKVENLHQSSSAPDLTRKRSKTKGSLRGGTRDSGVRQSEGMDNESGSGIVNRPESIKPSTQLPRVGSKKTNHYDEPWDDELLEKLENLPVDQPSIEANVARKGSKREGVCLPSTRM
ncbi:uncharacterized protein LOC127850375 isoform X2 [Dreissena polymorpha]|uniref:uncharacterized protein LOC127850375 isoform X2 n=1 Tax=Dreissena polymorpha TaxID=45954 RepID=UPI002264650B|nr:uncharacterized protein LOC127850375 isoform X2 [Dreissena polymorpha]